MPVAPNGSRYLLVGGTRRRYFIGNNSKPPQSAWKRADSHQSSARCVGRFWYYAKYHS